MDFSLVDHVSAWAVHHPLQSQRNFGNMNTGAASFLEDFQALDIGHVGPASLLYTRKIISFRYLLTQR